MSELGAIAREAAELVARGLGAHVAELSPVTARNERGAVEVVFYSDRDGRWSVDLLWAHDDGWHLVGVSRSRTATRLYLEGDLDPGTSTRDLIDPAAPCEPEAPEPPLMAEVELVDYDAAAMSQAIAAALRALWPEPGA